MAVNKTSVQSQEHELDLKAVKLDAGLNIKKMQLQLSTDKMTKNEMDKKVRETVKAVGGYVRASEAKMVNIDDGNLGGGADDGGMQNMMGNMLMQYQAISNATN